MQSMNTQFDNRSLTYFNNLFFYLFLCFFNDFFDTRWMDTSIGYQALEAKSGYFPAERVKRGKYDRFRGVIDYEVYAGCGLYCPDVSSLPAYDLPFDFIA